MEPPVSRYPNAAPVPNQPAAAVTWLLLVALVAIHMLQEAIGPSLELRFALWPPGREALAPLPGGGSVQIGFQPWQLLTYGFLHGDNFHLLFNALALWMFGPAVEGVLGHWRFLRYFLLCIVGAAVAQLAMLALTLPAGRMVPTVGASGGIFGVLFAFGFLFPRRIIIPLFPPIPMPAWLAVTLFGLLELYLGLTRSNSGVAHFAHLGGMVVGVALFFWWIGNGTLRRAPPASGPNGAAAP